MRYIVAILLSILQANSLVCMVNDNNGSNVNQSELQSQEQENISESLGKYRDTKKKRYTVREYTDVPSLTEIPSEHITYYEGEGKYEITCPVDNCNVTYKLKRLKDARRRMKDHENEAHKRKYKYICSFCGYSKYKYDTISDHIFERHRSSQRYKEGVSFISTPSAQDVTASVDAVCDASISQLQDATVSHDGNNGTGVDQNESQSQGLQDDYRDSQRKRHTVREYINRPAITEEIPSENISYNENTGEYTIVCPVHGCSESCKSAYLKSAQQQIKDHENEAHKKRYKYMCNFCEFYAYKLRYMGSHATKKHPESRVHDSSGDISSVSICLDQNVIASIDTACDASISQLQDTIVSYDGNNGAGVDQNESQSQGLQDDYRDSQRKRHTVREYINRPAITEEIPSENISYNENTGRYTIVCPVDNCSIAYKSTRLNDVRKRIKDHENEAHKRKYKYMCNFCDFYGYTLSNIASHATKQHPESRVRANSQEGGSISIPSDRDVIASINTVCDASVAQLEDNKVSHVQSSTGSSAGASSSNAQKRKHNNGNTSRKQQRNEK